MLPRLLDALCLRALASPALGRVVRAGIVLALGTTSPRGEIALGRAGAVLPAR